MYVMTLLFLFFLFLLSSFLSPPISPSNILLVNPSKFPLNLIQRRKKEGERKKRRREKWKKERKFPFLRISFPSQSFEKEVQQKCLHFLLLLSFLLSFSLRSKRMRERSKEENKAREENLPSPVSQAFLQRKILTPFCTKNFLIPFLPNFNQSKIFH